MQSQELEDSFLIGQISAGDQEAFARFYDLHSAAVLGLVARVLGARGEAEEVLQEVFLQVWRQSDRYEAARSTPRGWLLMVARSRALDRLRRRDARGRHEQEAVAGAAFPRLVSPLGTPRLGGRRRRRRPSRAGGGRCRRVPTPGLAARHAAARGRRAPRADPLGAQSAVPGAA